jgi:hypothetical protein
MKKWGPAILKFCGASGKRSEKGVFVKTLREKEKYKKGIWLKKGERGIIIRAFRNGKRRRSSGASPLGRNIR